MQQPATGEHDPTRSRQGSTGPAPQEPPIELELGDGSRLVLDSADASPIVCRIEGRRDERICLEDAMQLTGQPFAGFRLLR
jgi:hypothetical protein